MNAGSSERVRRLASQRYVQPAMRAGKTRFSIAVKDLIKDLVADGFPAGNTPQVCTALRKKEFLRDHGLEIEGIDGPPSKMSTTVVYRYRVAGAGKDEGIPQKQSQGDMPASPESPEARARRLAGKLRGLLKDELAEYGGGEAFVRWVRGYDEEDEG
jgi:hypothetical protein